MKKRNWILSGALIGLFFICVNVVLVEKTKACEDVREMSDGTFLLMSACSYHYLSDGMISYPKTKKGCRNSSSESCTV